MRFQLPRKFQKFLVDSTLKTTYVDQPYLRAALQDWATKNGFNRTALLVVDEQAGRRLQEFMLTLAYPEDFLVQLIDVEVIRDASLPYFSSLQPELDEMKVANLPPGGETQALVEFVLYLIGLAILADLF